MCGHQWKSKEFLQISTLILLSVKGMDNLLLITQHLYFLLNLNKKFRVHVWLRLMLIVSLVEDYFLALLFINFEFHSDSRIRVICCSRFSERYICCCCHIGLK